MTQDGQITISPDGKNLIITNKKYAEKAKYVFEPDKHTVKRFREEHKKCEKRDTALLKKSLNCVEQEIIKRQLTGIEADKAREIFN